MSARESAPPDTARSIRSIGSAGSILSIGSAASLGSLLSFASVGSVRSAFSVLAVLGVRRGVTLAAVGGMVAANRHARLSRSPARATPG